MTTPATRLFNTRDTTSSRFRKEVERDYTIPEPQTAQEVIGYYSRRIAEAVKLPSQFAALAPKVKEIFEQKAFGQSVDLSDREIVKAMSTPVAHYVCVDVFSKALKKLTIAEQEPTLLERFVPNSRTSLREFVTTKYLPDAEKELRGSTLRGYKAIWNNYIDERCREDAAE